ncbi:MAG: 2-oxoacid:acceptor oxidoreductase family protein [Planctomycetota bacterium]
MIETQVVVCGLGGQGILFLSRLLGEAARIAGEEVISSETHGMSQRGGVVDSHVKIGAFRSSLVRRGHADAAFVLDPSRAAAATEFLREGGTCFADAAAAPGEGIRWIDATAVARDAGNPRGANLVLLGFASTVAPGLFPERQALLQAVEVLSAPAFIAGNRDAFFAGEEMA